eukprot:1195305-Prorocentrum_minimum.AAC.4
MGTPVLTTARAHTTLERPGYVRALGASAELKEQVLSSRGVLSTRARVLVYEGLSAPGAPIRRLVYAVVLGRIVA